MIEGLLPTLERLAEHPLVQSVTPGRISPRSGKGPAVITFQYRTETGLKLLARSSAAVQEVFVVTDNPDELLDHLRESGIVGDENKRSKRRRPRTRRTPKPSSSPRPRNEKAAQPQRAEPPLPPRLGVWDEILQRHQSLLELEERLAELAPGENLDA